MACEDMRAAEESEEVQRTEEAQVPIHWTPDAFHYDTGVNPSVAVVGSTVVEVHQATTGVGPLWSHTGRIAADGTVIWAPDAFHYDTGVNPSVAVVGSRVVEVHQATTGVGPLWSHTATTGLFE